MNSNIFLHVCSQIKHEAALSLLVCTIPQSQNYGCRSVIRKCGIGAGWSSFSSIITRNEKLVLPSLHVCRENNANGKKSSQRILFFLLSSPINRLRFQEGFWMNDFTHSGVFFTLLHWYLLTWLCQTKSLCMTMVIRVIDDNIDKEFLA